jgi:hypothetical protein
MDVQTAKITLIATPIQSAPFFLARPGEETFSCCALFASVHEHLTKVIQTARIRTRGERRE